MDRHVVIFDFDQTMVLENSLGFYLSSYQALTIGLMLFLW